MRPCIHELVELSDGGAVVIEPEEEAQAGRLWAELGLLLNEGAHLGHVRFRGQGRRRRADCERSLLHRLKCSRRRSTRPCRCVRWDGARSDSGRRSCTPREILTFGRTELILSPDRLLSMDQAAPILTSTYIIHNSTHMGHYYTYK